VSPVRVQEALTELRDKGNYCVTVDPGRITIEQPTPHPEDNRHLIDTEEFFGEEIKFGAISDTHLGSRWERLDVLKSLYDIFEREGVRVVFHAGNLIEGDARWNKYDVWVHGFEQQTQYAVDHYPQRKGIVTKFICGDDHEGWFTQREGIDFGRRLVQDAQAAGRNDLEYLGYVEADIELKAKHGSSVMRVMHPGGGTAYAISYTSQKIVESLQGGEKPAVLLLGHFHKFEQSYVRNVHVVQVGCCEDQSIFMRKRKLEAMVGGCLIKFRQGSTGEVNRFSCEWFPYFDRGFYGKKYDILRRVA
jgi:predicted phosphodiesterase